jgi:hypothetical protein
MSQQLADNWRGNDCEPGQRQMLLKVLTLTRKVKEATVEKSENELLGFFAANRDGEAR